MADRTLGLHPKRRATALLLRSRFFTAVDRIASRLEQSRSLCFLLLLAIYVPTVMVEAYSYPLRHDELFTWHIATAASVREMVHLARTIDLNPPLIYLLERWSLHLGPQRWLFVRLPSMLAGIAATWAIFLYAARRMGNLFGFVAVGVLWLGTYFEWCWQDRPYILWLAFVSLLLLAWDGAIRNRRSPWSIAAVFLCVCGALSSHILAAFSLLSFFAAEAVRCYRSRKVDWPLWLALGAPCCIALTYVGQMNRFSMVLFPPLFLASLPRVGAMYVEMFVYFSVGLSCCAFLAALAPPAEVNTHYPSARLEVFEIVLFLGLFSIPALIAWLMILQKIAFFSRYGIVGILGCAMLTTWFVYLRIRAARAIATLMVLALLLANGVRVAIDTNVFGRTPDRELITLNRLDPAMPIVAASGLTYLEMNDRESPALLAHVYYLTDPAAATRYAHATLFENEEQTNRLFHLRGTALPYKDFVCQHRRFYVVGTYSYPEDWLLRKLLASGADLIYKGKFQSSYKDDDLYLIRFPASDQTCEAP